MTGNRFYDILITISKSRGVFTAEQQFSNSHAVKISLRNQNIRTKKWNRSDLMDQIRDHRLNPSPSAFALNLCENRFSIMQHCGWIAFRDLRSLILLFDIETTKKIRRMDHGKRVHGKCSRFQLSAIYIYMSNGSSYRRRVSSLLFEAIIRKN